VVCRYNAEVGNVAFKLLNSIDVVIIKGDVKDRHAEIQRANKLDKCVVVVNAACSEGYELPTFDLMVFYSYDFSLKNFIQMKGRVQRINNVKKNVYLSLINKNTIDEDVYKSIQKKEDFDLAIYKK
jgi:predicted helicase